MPRKRLTKISVERIRPPPKGKQQVRIFDAIMPGLVLRVSFGGAKSWYALHYVNSKGRMTKLGRYPIMTLDAARTAAQKFLADPEAAVAKSKTETFKTVAEDFIKRHVEAKKLRSQHDIIRCIKKYLYPEWEDRQFASIGRDDVAELLDDIEDNSGPRMADAVLAIVRKMMNWKAARSKDYRTPIVRGMNRAKSRKRKHTLNDIEIRILWRVAPQMGTFGALVQNLLLTAQRRQKVATMKRADVIEGLWVIETEEGEKGSAGAVRLTKPSLALIEAQPKRNTDNPYVFVAASGEGHFNSFSQRKAELDELLRAELPDFRPWVLHDLRRTARTLMARAGVLPHIAERTLGHAQPELEETYDRFEYLDEKSDALEKLAALIALIINPPKDNIVPIRRQLAEASAS